MNKEIRFYLTDDGNEGKFIAFVRLNNDDDSLGAVQFWLGPLDDEQSQICVTVEAEEAIEILKQASRLLKE